MPEPFYGEIQAFAFDAQPKGWLPCDGRSLPVSQNQILYSLISNRYGGDTTNFNLPDLRGRTPVGVGESPSK